MTVGDTIQSVNGAGLGGVVTSVNGAVGPVDVTVSAGVTSVDGLTGAVDLSTRYLALTGGTLTGLTTASKSLIVNPATTGTTGLAVVGLAGQTGALQQWTNSVPTVLASIDAAGTMQAAGYIVGSSAAATGGIRLPSTTQINWRNAAGTGDIGGFSSNASDQIQIGAAFVPNADSSRALGTSTLRWASVYGVSGSFGGANAAVSGQVRLENTGSITWRNAANNADILGWQVTASDVLSFGASIVPSADNTRAIGSTSARLSQVHSVLGQINATGALGTVEKFRVTNPTTTDNTANVMIASSATSSKPLVVQGIAAQSANWFEVQDSTGAAIASIGAGGAFATSTGNVTAGGGGSLIGGVAVLSGSARIGSNVSATGLVRLGSTGQINWRNVANTGDIGGFSSNASDQIQVATTFVPSTDNTKDLGTSSVRFANLYAANSVQVGAAGNSLSVPTANVIDINAGSSLVARLSSNAVRIKTTSVPGTVENLAVNTKTTADNAANVILSASATTAKPLVVQAIASQSANVVEVQSSAGAMMAQIESNGAIAGSGMVRLYGGPQLVSTASTSGSGFGVASVGGVSLYHYNGSVGLYPGEFGGVGGIQTLTTTAIGATTTTLTTGKAASVVAAFRGIAAQTGDLTQWQSNTPTTLFAIDAAGLPQWTAAANQQTTVGAAGGASAPPATPTKYLKIKDSAGTTLVVPAYAAA